MNRSNTFHPPRQRGLTILVLATALLSVAGYVSARRAFALELGPQFLLYMLPGIVALVLTPLLAYRAYALTRATYTLERDLVILRWGLRSEQIPMNAVLWVRQATDLDQDIPAPLLPIPGALSGRRNISGFGQVEYLASTMQNLVLVATRDRLFAVSPADADGFLLAYRELSEQGSLSHVPARSVYPAAFLSQVWSLRAGRLLILSGLILNLALIIFTITIVPTHDQVYMGFDPFGFPRDPLPSVRLLLLPALSASIYLFDTILGMFLFRQGDTAPLEAPAARLTGYTLAHVLWGAGAVTPLLFLVGSYYLLLVSP